MLDISKRYFLPWCKRVYPREITDAKGVLVRSDIVQVLYIHWDFWMKCWKSDWVMVDPVDLTKGDSWLPLYNE